MSSGSAAMRRDDPALRERVRALVLEHGWNATSYQVLNPGFEYWFTDDMAAVVAYVRRHGVRVVAGVPICAAARTADAAAAFEQDAARHSERVVYFAAERRALPAWLPGRPDATAFVIGAQPVWSPHVFVRTLQERPSLRAQLHRAENKGVTVSEWDTARAESSPELRMCLAQWLDRRGLPALRFLVEPDTLSRLADRHVFVAQRAGAVVGFVVASPITARRGWLIEQVVRGDHAPNGTAELMLRAAACWRESGRHRAARHRARSLPLAARTRSSLLQLRGTRQLQGQVPAGVMGACLRGSPRPRRRDEVDDCDCSCVRRVLRCALRAARDGARAALRGKANRAHAAHRMKKVLAF